MDLMTFKWRLHPPFLFMLLLITIFCQNSRFSATATATDSIHPGQSLTGNQRIISKEGNFELGFFSPGNSRNFYVGIWFRKIGKSDVIWVANREVPVSNTSAVLKISKNGNLILTDHEKVPVWSTNTSSSSSASSNIVVLLDTGNLVIRDRDNSSLILWQSFDHPTDTIVSNGWLGMNKITGEYQRLVSWKNPEDPSPGAFTATIDPDGSNQFLLVWNGSRTYWTSGVWNGRTFGAIPSITYTPIFINTFIDDDQGRYFKFLTADNKHFGRNVMDSTGQIKTLVWSEDNQDWIMFWSEPVAVCEIYSVCGSFGICSEKSMPLCACSDGFQPQSERDWKMNVWGDGCRRKTSLKCERDGFLGMQNMKITSDPKMLMMANITDQDKCRIACLNNCSCTAYSFSYSDGGCMIWIGDIRNLQQLSESDSNGATFHLRLAASDIPSSNKEDRGTRKAVKPIIIGVSVGILVLSSIILMLYWRTRRRSYRKSVFVEGSVAHFKYSDLQRMTRNFSERLGAGGFGSVFRGKMGDGAAIAVKRLEGSVQKEKQFRAEVSTLGSIHHVNLIRLRGFCCEEIMKRLLVYDFMPMGSLDHHLFRHDSKKLDWKTRHQIILGVAKGIEYLHEKCRECIIHCDIKPENVLLDINFNPKVSDFGLAKLLGRDFSRVLTTARGTIGYLAPEWILGLPITAKADVYSYGMMLFEIVSGRRNAEQTESSRSIYFPIWAAGRLMKGEILSILDEYLNGNADIEELRRVCTVACWCIQDREDHRPAMGLVVQMLEGIVEASMPPIPSYLQHLSDDQSMEFLFSRQV
ncbi:G-type lectin S-receptor-like serine/threonine-protein kinase [Apostasia shenzhenica]|uniref:Receptor-like serine/threonine-protein kinase n=1 Tax=Apostasia shenzhenica TaxID=1088818 RepID=A0A2I0AA33_9ASPA|nr:G-type lectin S-receptor-like serine/threonine-protein kinase [Apostasia shenzhenica]